MYKNFHHILVSRKFFVSHIQNSYKNSFNQIVENLRTIVVTLYLVTDKNKIRISGKKLERMKKTHLVLNYKLLHVSLNTKLIWNLYSGIIKMWVYSWSYIVPKLSFLNARIFYHQILISTHFNFSLTVLQRSMHRTTNCHPLLEKLWR